MIDYNDDCNDGYSYGLVTMKLAPSKAGMDDDDGADQPEAPMLKSLTPVPTTTDKSRNDGGGGRGSLKRVDSNGSLNGLKRVGSNNSLRGLLKRVGSNNSLNSLLSKDSTVDDDMEEEDYMNDTGYHPDCPPISMKPQLRKKYEVAIVACGCFLNPQYKFKQAVGVKRVVVGYIGGTGGGGNNVPCPTYQEPQDFTQALLIEYNPKKITYRQILELWHENDTPYDIDDSLTYQSGIFVQNESQKQIAYDYLLELEEMKLDEEAKGRGDGSGYRRHSSNLNRDVHVRVDETSKRFYMAEERYQDYIQKQKDDERKTFIDWANEDSNSSLYALVE